MDAAGDGCVAMSALDGRWRTVPCGDALPIACKAVGDGAVAAGNWAGGAAHAARAPAADALWHLGCNAVFSADGGWTCEPGRSANLAAALGALSGGIRGVPAGGSAQGEGAVVPGGEAACAPGFEVAYPHIAWDNMALWRALVDSGEEQVMLPLRPGADPEAQGGCVPGGECLALGRPGPFRGTAVSGRFG